MELALEPSKTDPGVPPILGFNPCFCGTGARTSDNEKDLLWQISFNPCFCGTGARTLLPFPHFFHLILVSILVFVELALEHHRREGRLHDASVSILVFVELALEPWEKAASLNDAYRFNPCFCGTGARTRSLGRSKPIRNLVSILVFVELALERRRGGGRG